MFRIAYRLSGWLLRLAMVPVVARRHAPATAVAWLGTIAALPVPGTLAYLLLARLGLERSVRKHRHVRAVIQADDRVRARQGGRARLGVRDEQRDLVRMAENLSTRTLGGFPILDGNRVELLTRPGEMLDRLIGDVDGASGHVHLTFFQWKDDDAGRAVAHALARAVRRGVRCRVLVDAWATRHMRRGLGRWMEERGIELRPMLPMLPMHPLARMDVRNHRKIAVVDGRLAYTGSDNVHGPRYGLREGVWHQVTARVTGPAALQLQMLFVEDWFFATGEVITEDGVFPDPERPGSVEVQTIPGGPSYRAHIIQHLLVQALAEARRQVVLTTPYLVPDEPLLLALRLAALRGVRVDVVLPLRSDRRVADLAGRAYFAELLDAGVRVHLHPSGIVHAKTLAVDHAFAIVGTANLDRRSLYLNYENVLVLYDRGCTDQLRGVLAGWLRQADRVQAGAWRARPAWRAYAEHTAKLLSPLL